MLRATASSISCGAAATMGSPSGYRRSYGSSVLPTCPRVGGPPQPSALVLWRCSGPAAVADFRALPLSFSRVDRQGSSPSVWLTPLSLRSQDFSLAAIGTPRRLAHVLEPRRKPPYRQSCRSRHCAGQLRRSCWRICWALRHGMAARCYASLFRWALGHRWRQWRWADALVYRESVQMASVAPQTSRLEEGEAQT